MALLMTDAANVVRQRVNASSNYTTNDNTEMYPEAFIIDSLRLGDAAVYQAIAEGSNSPIRSQLLSRVTVNHAALIPPHIGPIGAVIISEQQASLASYDMIALMRRTPTITITDIPYYAINDNSIFFYPGNIATIDLIPFYVDLGNQFNIPESYIPAAIEYATYIVAGKEEALNGLAASAMNLYLAHIQALKGTK